MISPFCRDSNLGTLKQQVKPMKTINEVINKRDFYHKQAAKIAAKHRKSILKTRTPSIDEVLNEAKEEHYRNQAAKLLAKAEHCRQKVLIANRREKLLKADKPVKPLLLLIRPKRHGVEINQDLLNKIRSI